MIILILANVFRISKNERYTIVYKKREKLFLQTKFHKFSFVVLLSSSYIHMCDTIYENTLFFAHLRESL